MKRLDGKEGKGRINYRELHRLQVALLSGVWVSEANRKRFASLFSLDNSVNSVQ